MITTTNHHLEIPEGSDLESNYPATAAQSLGALDNAAFFQVGTWADMPEATAVDPGTRYWVTDRSIEMVCYGSVWVWPDASNVPVGTMHEYIGTTAPTDPDGVQRWMLVQGQAISRTTYPVLNSMMSAAGYPFGSGDGSTTFNLPNMESRGPIGAGQGSGLTNRALGSTGGEETHLLALTEIPNHNHALTDPGHNHGHNDPGHGHGVSDPGHAHSIYDPGHAHSFSADVPAANYAWSWIAPGSVSYSGSFHVPTCATIDSWSIAQDNPSGTGIGIYGNTTGIGIYGATTGVSNVASGTGITIAAAGGGTAHNNMAPFVALNWIVKVL